MILSAWPIIPIILSVRSCYTLYIYTYRVSLNYYYKLWELVMGTKTITFCIGTHDRTRTVSPLKPKHAMFGPMKIRVQCVPMDFSNAPVSIRGQGFWLDVFLGHTFFNVFSPVMRVWIFLNTYCMDSWKICHCMCVKTCGFSTMAHLLIFLVRLEVIWIEGLGKRV